MSLASILNQNEDVTFPEINAGVINCDVLNATVINGGGGGGGVTITSSDKSMNVTNGKGTVDLTDAGCNWSKYQAVAEVNMGNNALQNLSSFQFSPFSTSKALTMYQGYTNATGLNGLYVSDMGLGQVGNIGNIYDSKFNKPVLSDVLLASGDGGGYNISNVRTLTTTYSLNIVPLAKDTISVLQFGDSSPSTRSYQLLHYNPVDESVNTFQMQYYPGDKTWKTFMNVLPTGQIELGYTLADAPKVYVSGSMGLGQVYDTKYNPASLSSVLKAGEDGGGADIGNVNTVFAMTQVGVIGVGTAPATLFLGNKDASTQSSKCSWQLTHDNNTNACEMQYYDTTGLVATLAKVTQSGNVLLGNDSATNPQVQIMGKNGAVGTVYDSTFNKPPTGTVTTNTLAYTTTVSNNVGGNTTYPILWSTLDAENTVGTTSVTFSGNAIFTNSSASTVVAQVSCYFVWGAGVTADTALAIYGRKNMLDTDRYGYVNCPAGNDIPSSSTSFTIVLKPQDTFQICAWHNNATAAIQIPNKFAVYPNARIIITQIT